MLIKLPKLEKNQQRKRINKITLILSVIFLGIIVYLSGGNISINVKLNDTLKQLENASPVTIEIDNEAKLESSDTPVKTEVIQEDGKSKLETLNTYESIDGGKIDESFDLDKDARGETYPIDSPEAFAKATLDKCISMGNVFGSQCVSLARAYWFSYANRIFSTCGTGMAKGAWNCKEKNAGEEFILIYNQQELKEGDWIIFDGGEYGHVGMAMGKPKNGYISLLGENQGGKTCEGGGSATNIVNISLKNFIGAYRPKIYEPIPVPDTSFAK